MSSGFAKKWQSTTKRRVYGETKHGERVLHALMGGKIYAPPIGDEKQDTLAAAGGEVDFASHDAESAVIRVAAKGGGEPVQERWLAFEPGKLALPTWASAMSPEETATEIAHLLEQLAAATSDKQRAAARALRRILGE